MLKKQPQSVSNGHTSNLGVVMAQAMSNVHNQPTGFKSAWQELEHRMAQFQLLYGQQHANTPAFMNDLADLATRAMLAGALLNLLS